MKKTAAALAVLLLLLAAAGAASALELKAGTIRPFADNILTVTSEKGGTLTIEAISGTVPLKNPVTKMKIKAGKVEIPWNGLTEGGEPLQSGSITLRATLSRKGEKKEKSEVRTTIGSPMPAVLCCLPAAQEFYADGKNILRIEVAVSTKGTIELSIAPKDRPEEEVWHYRTVYDSRTPIVIRWDGRGKNRKPCPPGEYMIRAWSAFRSQYVSTAEITLLKEPLPELKPTVTGNLLPEDLSDDAAVWEALTAPVTVGDGGEGKGLIIMEGKGGRTGRAGTVTCRTVGLAVLETGSDGWVKVGAWRQADDRYIEGYVKADKLRVIRPNTRYGAVVDKKTQTITVYEYGKKVGTALVSTGLPTGGLTSESRCGVYLLGTRLGEFSEGNHTYSYPIRIDGYNLIHQAGFARKDGQRDFKEEIVLLGKKASHGCIRVDPRIMEESNGINAWWIWTHMGHDSKIIVMPGD